MAEQDWFTFAQDAASGLIKAGANYAQNRQQQKYEIEKLKLQALGTDGYYEEGQAGQQQKTVAGLSPTVLLLGGVALVAVLMLKD